MQKQINLPYRKPGHLYSVDAIQWDFQIDKWKLYTNLNANIHPDDCTDLVLKKKGVDYHQLSESSLFNIDGYFCYHDTDGNGLYLKNGVIVQRNLKSTHIGILNFEEMGARVKIEKMTHQYPEGVEDVVPKSVYLHLPSMKSCFKDGLQVKPFGIVFGGMLIWYGLDGELLKYVGDNVLKFDLDRYHVLQQIHRLKKIISKDDLGMTPYKDGRTNLLELKGALDKIVSSDFTFAVYLESEQPIELFYQDSVYGCQLPKRYFTSAETFHHAPLRISDGRYLPYVHHDDRNGIILSTSENRYSYIHDDSRNDLHLHDNNALPRYYHEMPISTRVRVIKRAQFLIGRAKG